MVGALGYAFSHSVDAVAKGAARAEHLLVLATTAALLAVGGVRRLRTRRQAQRPR
ncbi:alkaline phosphatase [Myxococcus xanthus]|nr:alkaline phosphatase [Myxococcus xanthus]